MTELDIISALQPFYPTLLFLADNQNGVHPKTVFCIVGEVSARNIGTATQELTSKDGKWLRSQTKEYTVRIGVQGKFDSSASDIAEDMHFMADTKEVKQALFDKGYTSYLDGDIQRIPIQKDTDMYLRHSFLIKLRTSLSKVISQNIIKNVEIDKGQLTMGSIDNVVYEYQEEIRGE